MRNCMERRRQYMAYFLFAVSILVLMVSVFPHHHHGGKFCVSSHCEMCMEEGCACSHHCTPESGCEHTCKSTCLTHLYYLNPDLQDAGMILPSFFTLILPLLSDIVFAVPLDNSIDCETYYLERLHSLHLTSSVGRRAPPFMVLS